MYYNKATVLDNEFTNLCDRINDDKVRLDKIARDTKHAICYLSIRPKTTTEAEIYNRVLRSLIRSISTKHRAIYGSFDREVYQYIAISNLRADFDSVEFNIYNSDTDITSKELLRRKNIMTLCSIYNNISNSRKSLSIIERNITSLESLNRNLNSVFLKLRSLDIHRIFTTFLLAFSFAFALISFFISLIFK